MTRRFRLVFFTGLVATLIVTGAMYAQGPGLRRGSGGQAGLRDFGGHGPGGPGRGGAMFPLGQLELTEAQRTQVRQLVQQHRQQVAPLVERLQAAADARRQAVEAVPVDEGRIRAASEQLATAQTDLAVQQARLRSDIQALLTPEQQQRAQQLRAERDARFQQRRQRMQQRRQEQPQPPV